MAARVFSAGFECKWGLFFLLVFASGVSIRGVDSVSNRLLDVRNRINYHKRHAVRTIRSEDGDIIDCIDIYKQPAFNHPALKTHKIQMTPTSEQTVETEISTNKSTLKNQSAVILTFQLWQKNGSCPAGTIPVRRIPEKHLRKFTPYENYGTKGPSFPYYAMNPKDNKGDSKYLEANRSYAILFTLGYNYNAAKADMRVWTPFVEDDDEYSTSRIALKNGPYNDYESVEAGWAVNPSAYGDKETRLYTYWTVDGSRHTGCFDLLCPGFVQTSNEVALGGIIQSIPVPGGLPWMMTLDIVKDPLTANWWVRYQERIYIGYWPAEIFEVLSTTAETVQWGGEVYSTRIGHPGHTRTAMGSGRFPDYVDQDSGWTKRMRIRADAMVGFKYPDWVYQYADDYGCYNVFLYWEYIPDPEFYFGGPGNNWRCP